MVVEGAVVSKKQHNKQVARAQQKRRDDKFERRTARNRIIIIVMAALMVLSLFAIPLTQWLASRGEAAAPTPQELEAEPSPETVSAEDPPEMVIDPAGSYRATIATSEGEMAVELDAAGAPVATNNLVSLARDGYYEGIIFHRVIDGFMIQGGDPTGTGMGGPGYSFEDELAPAEQLVEREGSYVRGTLAMANSGPDTNGSQFFIVHEDAPLPPAYVVFGEVTDGMDVVDAIAATPTDEADRPLDPIEITSVTIDEAP